MPHIAPLCRIAVSVYFAASPGAAAQAQSAALGASGCAQQGRAVGEANTVRECGQG